MHQPGTDSNICIDCIRRENHHKRGSTKVKPPTFTAGTIIQLQRNLHTPWVHSLQS